MKCSLGISDFLKEVSSLSHSIIFLYFFALITEEGFLISPWYSLELCIQMGISFLCHLLLLSSQLFVRPPQTTILPFCITFSWGWSRSLPPVQCPEPPSIVLHALCLPDRIPGVHGVAKSRTQLSHFHFPLSGVLPDVAHLGEADLAKLQMFWQHSMYSSHCMCQKKNKRNTIYEGKTGLRKVTNYVCESRSSLSALLATH